MDSEIYPKNTELANDIKKKVALIDNKLDEIKLKLHN